MRSSRSRPATSAPGARTCCASTASTRTWSAGAPRTRSCARASGTPVSAVRPCCSAASPATCTTRPRRARRSRRTWPSSRPPAPRAGYARSTASTVICAPKSATMAPPKRRSRMPASPSTGRLILVRHGQSVWNVENLFTGWHDVDLSEQGRIEAKSAGVEIRKAGLVPDIAFTSVLKRAVRTLWIVLDEMDLMWLPVERSWRLNERHYGALQGLDKAQTVEKHGEAQVKIWRRSYDIPPPPLEVSDKRHPIHDRRYADLDPRLLPSTESLKDTLARVLPLWSEEIAPRLRSGRNVLVAAHGNSLRAMVKMLDNVPESEIVELNIPTGVPLLYELDSALKPTGSRYLGDQDAIKAAAEAVRRQTEKR